MPEAQADTSSNAQSQSLELSLYDAGIHALSELVDLPQMTALRSLNLHANRIETISHLDPLTQLAHLNLSSNRIEAMGGMHALVRLQTLDLSCNRVRIIADTNNCGDNLALDDTLFTSSLTAMSEEVQIRDRGDPNDHSLF